MSTFSPPSDRAVTTSDTLTIALAGNPNSGKTTIFNALTGLRQKVANYPGVTVEKKTGRTKLPDGRKVTVVDLPGTYSLVSRSPDERVAMEVLRGLRADTPAPDVVVVVIDASNLQRNLYLVSQLIELGRPMVVALNMMDIAERRGLRISAERLSEQLGVPVVAVVGHKGKGIQELKAALVKAAVAPVPDWPLPDAMKSELRLIESALGSSEHGSASGDRALSRAQQLAERLLVGDYAADAADISSREPIAGALRESQSRLTALGIDPMQADIEAHYNWIDKVAAASLQPACADLSLSPTEAAPIQLGYATKRTLTARVDRIFMHKVWGFAVFGLIMATLFVSVFWLADPVMGAIEGAVEWLGEVATASLADGPVKDLITDGIFAGVGGVVVFVPQIAILFMFLAILEDSGYLARAAFLMDRVLAKVGLHGKSFIPLLSSFACAIPGVMAARTIENRKDRLATIFVAPFMSCSARLPVYALLIGAFFAQYGALTKGGILLSLYAIGVIAAAGTAWIFKRSFLKGPQSAFILEMPAYKVPQLSQVARAVWNSTREFLLKAGTIIFCLSVILWALMYYPRLPEDRIAAIEASGAADYAAAKQLVEETPSLRPGALPAQRTGPWAYVGSWDVEVDPSGSDVTYRPMLFSDEDAEAVTEKRVAGEQLRQSYAGRFGHVIEPILTPLGYDWKMGIGLVGAFAAREVFVSTMGIVYSVGDDDEDVTPLTEAIHADTYPDGRKVWTPLIAASLLVWFVLAMQCMSTLAIVKRETGGWKWPIAMLLYMNGLAYVACLLIYQIGTRVFGA